MTRKYRLGRRGEAADETRRRIVKATYDLHAERGVSATTMKDIAARANVSAGTVYHHFPTYDDAIQACGQLNSRISPQPSEALLDGIAARAPRIVRLIRAYFAYYASIPNYGGVFADRDKFAPLRAYAAHEQAGKRALAARALGAADAGDPRVATLVALLDFGVFDALAAGGKTAEAAADEIAAVANAWLDRRDRRRG